MDDKQYVNMFEEYKTTYTKTYQQNADLVDIKNGKRIDWNKYKRMNTQLSEMFITLFGVDNNKWVNFRQCAEYLFFEQQKSNEIRLKGAWFCKNQLCPICNWRRSLKVRAQLLNVINKAVEKEPKGRFLFLTLTVRNVIDGDEINDTAKKLSKAFEKMVRRKKIKENLIGYFKAFECTVNHDEENYHPHLHVLLFMKARYFKGKNYLTQNDWTEFWKKAMKLDYKPIVNIKAVKSKSQTGDVSAQQDQRRSAEIGVANEVAKYSVKSMDILRDDLSEEKRLEILEQMDIGMRRVRRHSFGGLLGKLFKELYGQKDDEDLINVYDDDENDTGTGKYVVAQYQFFTQKYKIV